MDALLCAASGQVMAVDDKAEIDMSCVAGRLPSGAWAFLRV